VKQTNTKSCKERGFTAIEMIVVVAIIAILGAIALPSFLQWRESLGARTTARQFVEMLRQAKSAAITTNLEHQVQFDATNRRFGMRSSAPLNTSRDTKTGWTAGTIPAITNWTTYPSSVTASPAGVTNIQFTPDGAANFTVTPPFTVFTVTIENIRTTATFTVQVTTTGHISISR
jgi:type II secretion system protein H